jgi:ATP-binding cassette, subfamily B, bacterial IrtB/YbtQ
VLRIEPLPEAPEPIEPVGHDLELESVAFRHGDRTVIDNLSFTVPEGQRLTVVGTVGCG